MPNPFQRLSIVGFLESEEEKEERNQSEITLFANAMSMFALDSALNNKVILEDFKELYALSSHGVTDLSPSNIYYMEIIDENPDDNETMRHIAELLLENASSPYQDSYVILVGDGKTYEHLIQIK